jgi:hypothetical protein
MSAGPENVVKNTLNRMDRQGKNFLGDGSLLADFCLLRRRVEIEKQHFRKGSSEKEGGYTYSPSI